MPTLNDLPIATAVPSDRPHLLLWDSAHSLSRHTLEDLRYRHGTHRVDYRQYLLDRHTAQSSSPNLLLHRRLDREVQALRDLCADSAIPKSYIQLEGLETLITYIATVSPADLGLFWQQLIDLRHLPKRLWIVLPKSLVSDRFPRDRCHIIDPVRSHDEYLRKAEQAR
jgi:hypothetical protein